MKPTPLWVGTKKLFRLMGAGLSRYGMRHRIYLIFLAGLTGSLITFQHGEMKAEWLHCTPRYQGMLRVLCAHHAWLFPTLIGAVGGILTFLLTSLAMGLPDLKRLMKLTQYQKAFETVGLKNSEGVYPTAFDLHEKKDKSEWLTVKSNGVGIDKFRDKIRDLESALGLGIDTFESGANPSIVRISLYGSALPRLCEFEKLKESLKTPYSFLIGKSSREIMIQCILSLPHMIIAGTTGGGKSIFFKQGLLGLLSSSPRIQMYLFDLKGGVEMNVFSSLPNVRVYKSAEEALLALQKINDEMDRRLSYLADKGFSKVDFERDQLDMIVVGVDEASELYGVSSVKSEQATIEKARELTDRITKLARATGIHVILATQKILKETIDTKIQENIGGRMVFKMNTIQGSLTVLGNKMAHELTDIPGRAIWSLGNRFIEVQAPYLSEESLKKSLKDLETDFDEGGRKNFRPMLEVMSHAHVGNDPIKRLTEET